jgi:hypothetical protein
MTEPTDRLPSPGGHGTIYGSARQARDEHTPGERERAAPAQPPLSEHIGQPSAPVVPPQSVPYEVQAYPMPSPPARTYPAQVYPAQVYPPRAYPDVYPPQPAEDAPWPLVVGEAPAPTRRGPGVAVAIVLTVLLVLGGAGTAAYFLIGGTKDRGASQPSAAVEGFLNAIYTNHSAREAGTFVCPRARNANELDQVVFNVKTYEKDYASPRTTWTYPTIVPVGAQASAAVTLTVTTANDQVAAKQITLLLVNDRGWWVCDVDATA